MPETDFEIFGYVAMSFGPQNAIKLFNKFTGGRDLNRKPPGIIFYQDGSFRSASQPHFVLDYHVDTKGTVVQQQMWQPAQAGDVHRHFRDAVILVPVFFRTNYGVGVDMSYINNVRAGAPLNILDASAAVPMGGLATTHFCLKWPGYSHEYKKQVELKDASRLPITMSKLLERVNSFVCRFLDEAANWQIDSRSAHWRVGRGFITKDNLYIVGLVHVSAGCWQPVIQLKGLNYP